jgi:hypothetical protein
MRELAVRWGSRMDRRGEEDSSGEGMGDGEWGSVVGDGRKVSLGIEREG